MMQISDLTNVLLNELDKGASLEDLANSLTKSINEAKAKYEEKKAAISYKTKLMAATNLLIVLDSIYTIWDFDKTEFKKITPEDLVNTLEELSKLINTLKNEDVNEIEKFLNQFVR